MLQIYYAGAETDREKFIFEQIRSGSKTILVVPDQFSLQTEKNALRFLDSKCLMDLMVTDFSALGHKIVRELEGHDPEIIDKYGRHMLLSVLIEQMDSELTVYRGQKRRTAFADQMNNTISEWKRFEAGPEQVAELIEELKQRDERAGKPADSYLTMKLADMHRIFCAYEEEIRGIYQDAEDYITYYAERIPSSQIVRDADIWIYGFDTFTPKNLTVIEQLLKTAASVSVVLLCEDDSDPPSAARRLTRGGGADLFTLTRLMMRRLSETAAKAGSETRIQKISGFPAQTVWSGTAGQIRPRIHLVRTGGIHAEAERAAAYVQSLVRDEGYRYGEIAVLCNDMDGRGKVLHRTFRRWDIPVFADQKRRVLHQPVVSFLLSLLEVLTRGFEGDGILGVVKSGLLGWDREDEELLENYTAEFRIRGSRWQKEFVWDGDAYTDEEMRRLNEMRLMLVEMTRRGRDAVGRRNTAAEKIHGLLTFLRDDFQITERIGQMVSRQQSLGLMEGAAETAQIWNAVCLLFEQIVRVIGERKVSNTLLKDMITDGLQALEIGLVPSSGDCVILGTAQRTRPGRIRALLVTGAVEGLLPMDIPEEGLLSRREMEVLQSMEFAPAGREQIAQQEEQIAICRMLALPSEQLYVSCSQLGEDGKTVRPSQVFRKLNLLQPDVKNDLNEAGFIERISSAQATVPYLADAIRRKKAGDPVCPDWDQVMEWYENNDPQLTQKLLRGTSYSNRQQSLGEELADALYRGDRDALTLSASRLEKYSGCPFAHFISYGLNAREQRLFEVGGREIGEVYHQCMMEFSREMTDAPAEQPSWQTVTEEQTRERVREILDARLGAYRGGLFESDGSNRFRLERIREICGDVAWTLVQQVRHAAIREMYFEEPFGRGGRLPAVETEAAGHKVRIHGIIDRMDILDMGEGNPGAVRIIDYKTGNNKIRTEEFEAGYRLQLMLYMDAAEAAGMDLVPAGIFYFKIKDFSIDGDESRIPDPEDPSDLENRMRKSYRMEGMVINDPAIIGAMDESVDGSSKAESMVIPVKYDPAKGSYKTAGGGILIDQESFRELMDITNRQVELICDSLCRGEIPAAPKREADKDMSGNQITACTYCGYRSICQFDESFPGCEYIDVTEQS